MSIITSPTRASSATQNTYLLTWKTDQAIWFNLPEQVWSRKNIYKTGIVQVGSREFSVISHSDNVSICPIAHFLHGKSHITRVSVFPLYFWSFKTGLETQLPPLYVNSPYLQFDLYSKVKNVLLLKIYHMSHQMVKI